MTWGGRGNRDREVDSTDKTLVRGRSLSEFYRARYSLACWISIALAIHSLDYPTRCELGMVGNAHPTTAKSRSGEDRCRGRCSLGCMDVCLAFEITLHSAGVRELRCLFSIDMPLRWSGKSRSGDRSYGAGSRGREVDSTEKRRVRGRSLSEFYRARYSLACWISIALAIHSLEGFLSRSLSTRLITLQVVN